MPRSGNTLFASVMNQNPEIAATANSITLEIMKIKNPFKDYYGRWKDDATMSEKTVWTLISVSFGFALGKAGIVLFEYIF